MGQESTASQMILYGKRMLFNGDVLDFEGRIARIEALTKKEVSEAVMRSFGEGVRAAAIVGKVNEPLVL